MKAALAGALIGLLVVVSTLAEAGGDPFVFVAVGEGGPTESFVEDAVGREVVTRPSPGHDGQFFFLQALDPAALDDITKEVLIPLRYRVQRVFFPLLVGLGGLVPIAMVPWTMALVYIASYGLGTWAVGSIAARRGLNEWWGLAFALNIGFANAVQVGGATTVAVALGLAAVKMFDENKLVGAGLLFAVSILTRETMILMLIGCLIRDVLVQRRWHVRAAAVAIAPAALWAGFLRWHLPDAQNDANGAIGLPLNALSEVLRVWPETGTVPLGLLTATMCAGLLLYSLRERDVLIWACTPYCALFFVLDPTVARMSFDYSRAIAPAYVGGVIAIALALQKARSDQSPSGLPATNLVNA